MTKSSGRDRSLVADEGVDEGSRAAATEGDDTAATGSAGRGDLLGEPAGAGSAREPDGSPSDLDQTGVAEPGDTEPAEAREARASRGSGQQLAEGEG